MADLLIIALLIGFIGVCVAYVGWCDRIAGGDAPASTPTAPTLAEVDA